MVNLLGQITRRPGQNLKAGIVPIKLVPMVTLIIWSAQSSAARNAFSVLNWIRPLDRPRRRWNNIELTFRERGCEDGR